jgi:preprotein translocase subunit SecD
MKRNILWVAVLILLAGSSPVFAQNALQEQQKKFQEMLSQVTWKNLAIDFYEVKDKSDSGFKPMTVKSVDDKNGLTYYVAKKSILSLKNMKSVDVTYKAGDDNKLRLVIRFNDEGKQILSDYTKSHLNEKMGVVIDGKLRLVANLVQPLSNGRVQVYGFDPDEAVSILQRYYQPKLDAARKFNDTVAATSAAKK